MLNLVDGMVQGFPIKVSGKDTTSPEVFGHLDGHPRSEYPHAGSLLALYGLDKGYPVQVMALGADLGAIV
jgi:hypothetical protein